MEPRLLIFSELRAYGVLYTRQHLYNLEARGLFPKRVALGAGRVGWATKEIKEWIREKEEKRNAHHNTP